MQLEGYTLGQPLGRGATATVYEATHVETGEAVAIKLYSSTRSLKPSARRRVQLELQTLSRLEHPAIVQLKQAGEHDGMLYLVMELVRGDSLQTRLDRKGPLGEGEARRLVQTLSTAVDYLHRCGVLHRDLKPDNVLLSARGPLVTDFGLARDLDDASERLTQSGALLGTPGYLAPEQASGVRDRVGKPADIYALGGVLYACLTGVPPVRGESLSELLAATVQGKITSPRVLRPDLAPQLERLCMTCLALDPAARPTAEALARELLAPTPLQPQPLRRHRGWVAALVGAALLASAGYLLLPSSEPPAEQVASCEALLETDLTVLDRAARRMIERYPDSALGYYYLGYTSLNRAGNTPAEALRWVEQALERDPESARAWSLAATLYRMVKDEAAADAALDRAVELDPLSNLGGRSFQRRQRGDLEGAEADARRWLELEPEHFLPWALVARLNGDAERWPEALEAYDQALQLAPPDQHETLYKERGQARMKAGDLEGALEDLERRCAKYLPKLPLGLLVERAQLLGGLKRYNEAAVDYREALDIFPNQPAWLYELFAVEANLGNGDEALRRLERAYELSTTNPCGPELKRAIAEAWEKYRPH